MELNNKVDNLREELISSTQEILRIKSVEDTGREGAPFGEGVSKALECALSISRRLGFKTVNLDGYVGYAEYGEGEDYIGVLGHLDVVPEGDGWIHPPYGAEIHDGKLYARGASDDKGPVIAALYGLKAIKDANLPVSKKVRIIFGTNEETGCKEMEHYLEREKPPVAGFTPDAEFPIIFAEKGLTVFDIVKDLNFQHGDIIIKEIKGGLRANMVPDSCRALLRAEEPDRIKEAISEFKFKTGYNLSAEANGKDVVITSIGISAHGSVPELGKNAIMQLFAFLENLKPCSGHIMDFIEFMNKYVGMESHGESYGIGLEDKVSGKLSFNVGTIDMNEERVVMGLNIRYPVTFKFEQMLVPFKARLEGTGIRIENMEHQDPLYFPEDHELIRTLQRVYREQTGNEPTLLAIGGGTYAKEMPNIVAFGPMLPGRPDIAHQANEYMEVEDLVLISKIYAHAIYELAK